MNPRGSSGPTGNRLPEESSGGFIRFRHFRFVEQYARRSSVLFVNPQDHVGGETGNCLSAQLARDAVGPQEPAVNLSFSAGICVIALKFKAVFRVNVLQRRIAVRKTVTFVTGIDLCATRNAR